MTRTRSTGRTLPRAAALAIATLMMAPMLPPLQAASGSPPPFGADDWIVTGAEVLQDKSLLLGGNLVIRSGGSLTISNSSLTVLSNYEEEHEIRVMAGGNLKVLDGSTVSAFDPLKTHGFWIDEGSAAELRDSTFLACGVRYREVNFQIIGGIVSHSKLVSVRNCTFTGAHIALTTYEDLSMESCSFMENYIAIENLQCRIGLTDCSFEKNAFASWPYSSPGADYTNCSFVNNSVGITSDASVCSISGCRFERQSGVAVYASALMHWYMDASTFNIVDTVFEGNYICVGHYPEVGPNRLFMSGCDMLNSSKYGLEWGNRGWQGNPGPDYTVMNISRDSRISNSDCILNGQVGVDSGGVLTVTGSELRIDGDWAGEDGIAVNPGGRLALGAGSTLRAERSSFQYSLRCMPGSAFGMDDAYLRDCGWDVSRPESSGPLLETSDIRICSSTIDFNPAALVFNGSRGALIEGSSLRGMELGLELTCSSVLFQNSTLASAAGHSISLSGSSLLDSVNSTLNRQKMLIQDPASRANFSWFVDVRATWADGSPAAGANLSINDKGGLQVDQGVTGSDGVVAGIILKEATAERDGNTSFTPHMFNCTKGKIWNLTAQNVNRSMELSLMLVDGLPPEISILAPADGSFLARSDVTVTGTARDNLAVDGIEVVLDGYSRLAAYSASGAEIGELAWNASFELEEGIHSIEAVATDMAGNTASAHLSLTVDLVAPRIRIASPQNGSLTNLSLVTVSGFMEPGSRVFICGTEARTDRDGFSGGCLLSEGENRLTATAVDAAGNSNSTTVTVSLDTIPPRLEVLMPQDGFQTRVPMVDVAGSMETGADVYVNGRQVVVSEPGAFRTTIALAEEVNAVAVDAVDRAGNHNVTVKKVILDTRPPFLQLISPAEGTITNRSSIIIELEAESGAQLSVGGTLLHPPFYPDRARISVPFDLDEGQNNIAVTARDAAGNQNGSTLHLTLDSIPPPLAIDSPANGLRTANSTVLLVGTTEPGIGLTVNGQQVPVAGTGGFGLELRLSSGSNRFTVRAQDAAGNSNEASVSVQRVPGGRGPAISPSGAGPDWPFIMFIALAATVSVGEGYFGSRYLGSRNAGPRREGV